MLDRRRLLIANSQQGGGDGKLWLYNHEDILENIGSWDVTIGGSSNHTIQDVTDHEGSKKFSCGDWCTLIIQSTKQQNVANYSSMHIVVYSNMSTAVQRTATMQLISVTDGTVLASGTFRTRGFSGAYESILEFSDITDDVYIKIDGSTKNYPITFFITELWIE